MLTQSITQNGEAGKDQNMIRYHIQGIIHIVGQ